MILCDRHAARGADSRLRERSHSSPARGLTEAIGYTGRRGWPGGRPARCSSVSALVLTSESPPPKQASAKVAGGIRLGRKSEMILCDRHAARGADSRLRERSHSSPARGLLAAAEYWRRVLGTVGQSSRVLDQEAIIARLIEADVASWTEYREDVWDLAQSFRVHGGRTAFLSNGVPEAMARIRTDRPLEGWFDVVIVSCEVGVAKPDPAIFQMCLSRLSVEPGHALFVDDRIENIEGAARLGIHTFHFVGADPVSRLVQSVRSLSA